MMRIIAGSARGTRLVSMAGDHTRPTSERAKEAVFSMLQFEMHGRCVLDLFAGSGQLALEALSRGADTAMLCDSSPEAVAVIRRNIEKTHMSERCTIHLSDYAALCRRLDGRSFDLVFLDPPYAARLVCPALRCLLEAGALAPGALIVCESEEADIFENDEALRENFEVRKAAKYGVAHITVLRCAVKEEERGKK